VRVILLEDACGELGLVPHFLKCDIEGGELGMVQGSLDFLARQAHMAFETHRMRNGSFTHEHLSPLVQSAGYFVERVVEGRARQSFMYATPRGTRAERAMSPRRSTT